MAYAYSTSEVCGGAGYNSTNYEAMPPSGDWGHDDVQNDTYDIERCAREGFLFYQNEEPREEEKRRKASGGYGHSGASTSGGVIFSTNNVPLMSLNATKAGMEGLDVETINKIIHEASEGSKFYEHKKKQQEKIDKRILEMRYRLENLTMDHVARAEVEVDRLVEEIEANTNMNRYYVHLDMDAFFASVEMRDDPTLRDIPMAVGSDSMLSTSNYAARKFGVRAAMPGFIARKLCPDIRIIPCNFKKYQEASRMVEETIREYDDDLFMCMDEADLDITPHVRVGEENGRDSTAWTLVQEMRKKIEAATKLTASAGIAPTRFLAKLCSDIKKPNGQCALDNSKFGIRAFLSAIPIRKVCGIGNVTEQMLKALEIHTCKDLWDKRGILSLLFKRGTFQNLLGIAMGTGSAVFRGLTADASGRKSLSCERTFVGTSDVTFLENLCKESLCVEVEKDLKAAGLCCKTITLKIKTTDYDVKTRARSIMERTDSAAKIFEAAWKIFMSYVNQIPDLTIRLMGVRVSSLEEKDGSNGQGTLHRYIRTIPANSNVPDAALGPAHPPSNFHNTSRSSRYDPPPPPPPVTTPASSWYDEREPITIDKIKQEIECTTVSCPVCHIEMESYCAEEADRVMNHHLDECLNRTKVKEIRSEFLSPPPSSAKKRGSAGGKVTNDAKKSKRTSELPINAYFHTM